MLTVFRTHRTRFLAVLPVLLVLVVPLAPISELLDLNIAQLKTVLIILLAAILWVSEWIPLFIVSFIILALELTWLIPSIQSQGITISDSLFFAPFFSNIILLFMGGFVLSSIMKKSSLDARFAQWILTVTKGNPSSTLLGIIVACAFLSMWMSNTATAAMMLTMVLPLIKRLRPDAPFRIALILAIPLACNLGGIGTPIGTPPNAIAISYLASKGIEVSFLKWMTLTLPFLIIAEFITWYLLLKIYPPGNEPLLQQDSEPTPFQARQWLTVAIFVITVFGWLIGGQFGLKTGTIALFPIIMAFWLGLLDQSDFRALPWDVLFMVAGGIALGVAIDVTDLGSILIQWMPVNASFEVLMMLIVVVLALLGTVMSNTATASLMIPIVISLSLTNQQMIIAVLVIALNCSTAMILPVSTPPNAIAFSSGIINVKDLARMGFLMVVLGMVVSVSIGPLYWFFIL